MNKRGLVAVAACVLWATEARATPIPIYDYDLSQWEPYSQNIQQAELDFATVPTEQMVTGELRFTDRTLQLSTWYYVFLYFKGPGIVEALGGGHPASLTLLMADGRELTSSRETDSNGRGGGPGGVSRISYYWGPSAAVPDVFESRALITGLRWEIQPHLLGGPLPEEVTMGFQFFDDTREGIIIHEGVPEPATLLLFSLGLGGLGAWRRRHQNAPPQRMKESRP